MEIAVTGSNGLIGGALCHSLVAGGHTVIRVLRTAPEASSDPFVLWDPMSGAIDAAALEGVQAVVHLAGEGIGDKRWSPAQKVAILESRSKGTELLAATIARLARRPSVLVSGSAIGFYGDRGDEMLDEHSGAGDLFLSTVCTAWEAATAVASDAGIRVAIARTGIVLSTHGGALKKMLPLFKLGAGGRLGSGRQWMSWISLDDEVAALRWLIDHEISGPANLVAPNPVTNAEFTKSLGHALHRPTVLPVPRFGPRLLLGRELADELLFASQRVVPDVLEREHFRFRHSDLAAIL